VVSVHIDWASLLAVGLNPASGGAVATPFTSQEAVAPRAVAKRANVLQLTLEFFQSPFLISGKTFAKVAVRVHDLDPLAL
jgi:hypothetical protein